MSLPTLGPNFRGNASELIALRLEEGGSLTGDWIDATTMEQAGGRRWENATEGGTREEKAREGGTSREEARKGKGGQKGASRSGREKAFGGWTEPVFGVGTKITDYTNNTNTSAQCVGLGRTTFPSQGQSAVVRMRRIAMRNGTAHGLDALMFGGELVRSKILRDIGNCHTEIDNMRGQFKFKTLREAPSLMCQNKTWRNAIVLYFLYHPFNYWHFLSDAVFQAYLLAGHLALDLDCPPEPIEYYYVHDWYSATSKDRHFFPVALAALGSFTKLSSADGCFSNVLYGMPRLIIMPSTNRVWWYGPRYSSWWHSFASVLRSNLNVSGSELNASAPMLAVHHRRMPKWLRAFDWNYNLSDHFDVKIEHITLDRMSMIKQMKLMSQARGLISLRGASFVNQLYMPEMSPVLEIAMPDNIVGESTPGCRTCNCEPRTSLDLMGIHLGHSFMVWKWCQRDAFAQESASEMLWHLLRSNKQARRNGHGWACHVCNACFHGTLRKHGAFCDTETIVPWPPLPFGPSHAGVKKCGPLLVGPTLLREARSFGSCAVCSAWEGSPKCPKLINWSQPVVTI